MEGQGTYHYKNSLYIGNWKKNKKEGKGIIHYSNGDCYDGDFLNNLRDGRGIYCYKEKDNCYQGNWIQNVPQPGFSKWNGNKCF